MSDVFASGDQTKDPAAASVSVNDLVGEGKKFKTADDLARGKAEADAMIERLKSENAGIREDLGKRVDAEAQLNELREEIKALRESQKPAASRDNTSPALTVDGIKSLVAETLTKAEASRTATQNVQVANDAAIKHFGSVEKASEAVKAKASELGLSVTDLASMAQKSPTAFLKIMGAADGKAADTNPLDPQKAVNEVHKDLGGNRTAQEGTKPYFDEMRKTNPKRYWTPAVQDAIFKAVKAGTYQL